MCTLGPIPSPIRKLNYENRQEGFKPLYNHRQTIFKKQADESFRGYVAQSAQTAPNPEPTVRLGLQESTCLQAKLA